MAEDDSGRSSRAPIRNDNAEFPDDAVEGIHAAPCLWRSRDFPALAVCVADGDPCPPGKRKGSTS